MTKAELIEAWRCAPNDAEILFIGEKYGEPHLIRSVIYDKMENMICLGNRKENRHERQEADRQGNP